MTITHSDPAPFNFDIPPQNEPQSIEYVLNVFKSLTDRISKLEEYMLYTHGPLMTQVSGKVMEESYVRDLFDQFNMECDDNSLYFVFALMAQAMGMKKEAL